MARKKAKARAKRDTFAPVISAVATILDAGEPTRFRYEAPCRHGLRAAMCLDGIGWQAADDTASKIVREALHRIGAVRPPWHMGQPEYVELPGFASTERYQCVRCAKAVPEDRRLYCSDLCAQATILERTYREAAQMSDYFASQRTFSCSWCGQISTWKPMANPRTFCSRSCAAKARWAGRNQKAA